MPRAHGDVGRAVRHPVVGADHRRGSRRGRSPGRRPPGGRRCHSMTASHTASVTFEIVPLLRSTPMVDPRVVADLARGHPPGVQADDHRVQPVHPPLALAHQARRERAGPVPGHHWSRRGPPRSRWSWSWSRPRALAAGRGRRLSLLIAQVLGQLGPQAALQNLLEQSGEQPPGPGHLDLSGVDLLEQAAPRPRSRATAEPHRARRRACSSPQSPSIGVSPSIRAYTDH